MISVKVHNAQVLNKFINKIKRVEKLISANLLQEVCAFAVAEGERLYSEHNHSSVEMRYAIDGDIAQVTANGKAVAFFEFGTGRTGQGTYPDESKLPQSGVPLTGNWEYYYPSESKTIEDGKEGWYFGAQFLVGRKAEAEMWTLCNRIREEIPQIIKKYMSGGA
jgi:hypothetical protein